MEASLPAVSCHWITVPGHSGPISQWIHIQTIRWPPLISGWIAEQLGVPSMTIGLVTTVLRLTPILEAVRSLQMRQTRLGIMYLPSRLLVGHPMPRTRLVIICLPVNLPMAMWMDQPSFILMSIQRARLPVMSWQTNKNQMGHWGENAFTNPEVILLHNVTTNQQTTICPEVLPSPSSKQK